MEGESVPVVVQHRIVGKLSNNNICSQERKRNYWKASALHYLDFKMNQAMCIDSAGEIRAMNIVEPLLNAGIYRSWNKVFRQLDFTGGGNATNCRREGVILQSERGKLEQKNKRSVFQVGLHNSQNC